MRGKTRTNLSDSRQRRIHFIKLKLRNGAITNVHTESESDDASDGHANKEEAKQDPFGDGEEIEWFSDADTEDGEGWPLRVAFDDCSSCSPSRSLDSSPAPATYIHLAKGTIFSRQVTPVVCNRRNTVYICVFPIACKRGNSLGGS